MKKSFLLTVAALGVAAGARGDILLSFAEATDAGGGEWLYRYEVQLMGGGNLIPNDPYYDSGLFSLFDLQGYVPGTAQFTTYGAGTFSLGVGDLDGQGDDADIQGSYDGVYDINAGDYIGEVSFRSTVGSRVNGTYDSYADQEGQQYFVNGASIEVPGGFVPPTTPVPETSTVISAGVLGLLGAGHLIRRRRAAAVKA